MRRSCRYLTNFVAIVFLFFLCTLSACDNCAKRSSQNPHPSNHNPAGPPVHKAHLLTGWYVTDPELLRIELKNHFSAAQEEFPLDLTPEYVRAIIVPHAGHQYSGLCAASAYQAVKGFTRVIILAPSHRYNFPGVALPDYSAYRMPLGEIPVDQNAIELLRTKEHFSVIPRAHDPEHSLEVQLPFLQERLAKFSMVPLIVGRLQGAEYEAVARELAKIIDDKTLLVISSDFLHHGPNYRYNLFTENILRSIRRVDSQAINAISDQSIEKFDAMLDRTKATICGRGSIKILLHLINQGALGQRPLSCRLASYYTSAQVTGARFFDDLPDAQVENSVSYAGLVFTREPSGGRLTAYEKRALLALARESIASKLHGRTPTTLMYPIISEGVKQVAGAFVSLYKNGKLRGCIGRVETDDLLFKSVAAMAQAAAFHDTRFSPLTKDEFDDVKIDITVLTRPQKVASYKEIEVGKHGIILKNRAGASAVYLPQVATAFGGDLEKMLSALSRKAGLNEDAWRGDDVAFEVFEGFGFSE